MAAQAILAGLQMGAAAAPLFFGENNIFSGKARKATKMLERNFNESQAMGVPTEMTQALQNRLSQANVGIPGAALGLYQQQAGRAQASQLGALGSRRSALAGIGGIAQAGQDAALQMAGMQGQALQAGQERANEALMGMGQFKYQDTLRKQQEAADYWGTRKAEANAAVSSSLSALGQAAGSAISSGAFKKAPGLGQTGGVTSSMQKLGITTDMMQGADQMGQSFEDYNQTLKASMPQRSSYGAPALLRNPSIPNSLWAPKINQLTAFVKK